jgi:mannose-6-phosphate isomerase class I
MDAATDLAFGSDKLHVIALVKGKLSMSGNSMNVTLSPGEFGLIPASVTDATLRADAGSVFLMSTPG